MPLYPPEEEGEDEPSDGFGISTSSDGGGSPKVDKFTGCTRGVNGTLGVAHSLGAEVQGQRYQQGLGGVLKVVVDTDSEGDYNMIIYNAGITPDGYEYLNFELDPADTGKEIKMKFYDWKGISQDQLNLEKTTTGWGGSDTNIPTPGGNPLSGGNTYTSTWAVTVSSDSEWQDAYIERLITLSKAKSSNFFRTGRQKFKSSSNMIGSLNFNVNEIVTVVQPSQGITKRLRIKGIQHTINSSGWFTNMTFETDPEAA